MDLWCWLIVLWAFILHVDPTFSETIRIPSSLVFPWPSGDLALSGDSKHVWSVVSDRPELESQSCEFGEACLWAIDFISFILSLPVCEMAVTTALTLKASWDCCACA